MKKILSLGIAMFFIGSAIAQNPVSWSYKVVKLPKLKGIELTFEIHITATIQRDWHLYSQTQPEDAIAIPTTIKFNKNSLVALLGKMKEAGKLEKFKDKTVGIEHWQYADKVEFIQVVQLKKNIKTNISGNIEFQTCTDEKCLPPAKIEFSVSLK